MSTLTANYSQLPTTPTMVAEPAFTYAIDASSWALTGAMLFMTTPLHDDLSAADAIERGLPAQVVPVLENFIGSDCRRKLIPDRTLARRIKDQQSLTAAEGDRILQTAHVVAVAVQAFGSQEKARKWLHTPKKRFSGRTPLDLAAHSGPGATAVEQVLGQIAAGFFA